MKKGICTFAISACLVALSPFVVHADETAEPEEKPAGLISGTLNTVGKTVGNVTGQAADSTGSILKETVGSVDKTVKDTLEFTGNALNKASDPAGNKIVASTLKDTGKLVEKVVGNTTPVAKTTVKEVTNTTEKTTSEVFKAVDQTVDNLPEVPVVAPVVKEVNKTVAKVTGGVQKTVEKTNDAVNGTVEAATDTAEKTVGSATEVIDKAADLPYEEEKAPALQTPEKNEQAAPAPMPAPVENPMPAAPSPEPSKPVVEVPAAIEKPAEEEIAVPADSEQIKVPAESINPIAEEGPAIIKEEKPVLEAGSGINPPVAALGADIDATPEAFVYEEVLTEGENELAATEENKTAAVSKAKLPVYPEDQDRGRSIATVPASSSSSSSVFASNSFAGHQADLSLGTLSDADILKASTEKLWYHKNSYAIIQWIHTPLRQPPIHAPFLYVI